VTDIRRRSGPANQRRAIVTGGAGFIGSHLVDRLLADGVAVLVVDDLSSGTSEKVPAGASFERLDIADDEIDRVFGEWRPEVVFHLAAQASVPRSHQAPMRDLAVNVTGTHRVAAAARDAGARRLVFVSSGGAVYGETSRAATETTLPTPTSYYGVHKLAAEGHVALAGLPYAIARPSNVYGPRQGAGLEGAVVAAFLEQAVSTGVLRIHGDGLQTRDFVHVDDVVAALLRLAEPETPSGTWNVASGRSGTILALAETVERAFGRQLAREFTAARAGDVRHSAVSASGLKTIGWRPSIGLSSGIASLVRSMRGASDTSGCPESPAERPHKGGIPSR
jgi:UDP-glucose 4-epimerase